MAERGRGDGEVSFATGGSLCKSRLRKVQGVMPNCSRCGEEIEFRYIDGRSVPLHVYGGWACGGSGRADGRDYAGYARSDESCCYLTTCPECGNEVYFIRYNGGSVWINPPLGWPWDKHRCMDRHDTPLATRARSTLAAEISADIGVQRDRLVVGVVRETETSGSKRSTIINVETGRNRSIVLLIKNNAGFLLGRLVVYDKTHLRVWWLEDRTYTFQVIAEDKPDLASPASHVAGMICPECQIMCDPSMLSEHLKIAHRIPRPGFGAVWS